MDPHASSTVKNREPSEERLRALLARIMLWGVLLAASVMLVGGVTFLASHWNQHPGDHKFTGEPGDLRHPVAILKAAISGNDDSLIQAGVLLLLANPLVRVMLAAWGYAASRDRLYAGISTIVLAVLIVSFFV